MIFKGFYNRFREFWKELILGLCAVAAVLLMIFGLGLVESILTKEAAEIVLTVWCGIVLYLSNLWYATYALKEEKRVREEGFFWVEEDS